MLRSFPQPSPQPSPTQEFGEQVAAGLILITVWSVVLGRAAPETMGMAPLLGALALLLLGTLRRDPLSGGWLVVLMLSLRIHLRGGDRYLSEEVALSDVLMVMIAFAAAFRASRVFWLTLQTLLSTLIPVAGVLSWKAHLGTMGGAFAAGNLTAPQSALVFGLCLCFSLPRLWASLASPPEHSPSQRALPLGLWGLSSLISAGLVLASGGVGNLLLVGVAVGAVAIALRLPQKGGPAHGIRALGFQAGLLACGAMAAIVLAPAPTPFNWGPALQQRLAVLGCFLEAPFRRVEWFVHGVGFTNSSSWLCARVAGGEPMLQANNVLAQLAADTGVLTVLVLGGLLAWMGQRIWQLGGAQSPDPVAVASLAGALYGVLDAQLEGGWTQSLLIQVMLGLQLAAVTTPQEAAP